MILRYYSSLFSIVLVKQLAYSGQSQNLLFDLFLVLVADPRGDRCVGAALLALNERLLFLVERSQDVLIAPKTTFIMIIICRWYFNDVKINQQ